MEEKIKNSASVELELCGKTIEVTSDPIEITPIKLSIIKTTDCDFVAIGEKIKYTIVIANECGGAVHDVKFKDELDECVEFVEGSFKVGDDVKHPEIIDGVITYEIEEIESCDVFKITFEVVATESCCRGCHPDPEQSAMPTVRPMFAFSPAVGGTGVSGATIYVERPSGQIVTTTVLPGGSWNLVLATPAPRTGDVFRIWQVEPSKKESDVVTRIVGG